MSDKKGQLIPFGKYKGQPIEVLANDPGYVQWLTGQDWFREKYGDTYTLIINNFAEPSETPEHNALQVRFLDDDFCLGLLSALGWGPLHRIQPYTVIINRSFESRGWDVAFTADVTGHPKDSNNALWPHLIEIKPSIGDDYPAILRQMKANSPPFNYHRAKRVLVFDTFTATGATLEQVRAIFKSSNIAVIAIPDIEAVCAATDIQP